MSTFVRYPLSPSRHKLSVLIFAATRTVSLARLSLRTFHIRGISLQEALLNMVIAFELPTDQSSSTLTSQAAAWHRSAPKKVVKAYGRNEMDHAWTLWRAHLRERSFPREPKPLRPGGTALCWSISELNENGAALVTPLLRALTSRDSDQQRSATPLISRWIAASQAATHDVRHALEALALGYALPRLVEALPQETWWALVDRLRQTALDAAALDPNDAPMPAVWLRGELPLVLAHRLPEWNPCRSLWPLGKTRLSALLDELLDGEGLPHARHLNSLRPLLASATRASLMAETFREECFLDEAQVQFDWLLRRALELTRSDGTQMMSKTSKYEPALFEAAIKTVGSKQARRVAKVSLPHFRHGRTKRVYSASLPECSNSSEWSALALLRGGWLPRDARLLVKYDSPQVELELETPRGIALSGSWNVELEIDGKPLAVAGPWEEICWQADFDVAYVELECSLPGGWALQRQILLAKNEQFLFMADAVLGQQSASINYRGSLPLAPRTSFLPETETREGVLSARKPQGLVLPLALPEWRRDPRFGTLASTPTGLVLEQTATAQNLYCPLLIDLHPRRLKKQRTWRQLTIAENRQIQPAETAVGYRAQCGDDQWFFYRSLGPKGNRTLLSHNLVSEFLAARFETDGTIEELLEIE